MTFACRTLGAEAGLNALLASGTFSTSATYYALTEYELNSNGLLYVRQSRSNVYQGAATTTTTTYTWKIGGGTGADYQVRWQTNSITGALTGSSSAVGSWLALSSTRSWGISASTSPGNGQVDSTVTATIQIRMAAVPNTQFDSKTITLTSTANGNL